MPDDVVIVPSTVDVTAIENKTALAALSVRRSPMPHVEQRSRE